MEDFSKKLTKFLEKNKASHWLVGTVFTEKDGALRLVTSISGPKTLLDAISQNLVENVKKAAEKQTAETPVAPAASENPENTVELT